MANLGKREAILGRIAVAGILVFVAVVVSLHFVQPGYDATTQLMSELALGPHGEFMYVAFGGLAVATLGVALGLCSGKEVFVLRALLVVASLCFAIAGIFTLGSGAQIHIVSVAVGFVLVVLAMYLGPRFGEQALLPSAGSSWSLAAGAALSVAAGHSVLPMGISQRLGVSFIIVWLILAAFLQIKVRRNV